VSVVCILFQGELSSWRQRRKRVSYLEFTIEMQRLFYIHNLLYNITFYRLFLS
jgi:hypothetical protein